MSLEPGTKVGRYTISRLVAQGGMAAVYRAEQDLSRGISRPVAVKVIRPEYSESEDFREMFLDEARTACTLSHPNIVHIYEVGETDDGSLFMAMELVAGETLATINRTLRDNDERLSDEALFAIGILTCSALEAVHALKVEGGVANLVHRDVSPHNLLLSTSGSLKLIDFGIAKAATNRNLTMPGVTKGKAGYFSPEQAMGKKLDGRSDLFSLGVTLYKLASGGTPFDDYKNHAERHAALVRGQWQDLEETYPGLPHGLYEVVRRSLALKPEDRYQTAREMREALEKAAFDAGVRVGQSSLLGYLDEEGEITAEGGSRAPAAPGLSAAPSITIRAPVEAKVAAPSSSSVRQMTPYRTERLEPVAPPETSQRKWLLLGAFAAAMLAGIAVVAAVSFSTPDEVRPKLPEAPRVVVPPKPATPPEKVAAPLPPARDPERQVIDAGETTVVVNEPPPRPVAVKPPPRPKPPSTPREPKEPRDAPPPVERAPVIPEGEGKLVVNVNGTARYHVLLDGKELGIAPVRADLRSGVYTVTVKAEGGGSSKKKLTLMPNGYERMMFEASELR